MSKLEDEIDLTQMDEILARFKGQPDALIEVLHWCQEAFGYIPREVQKRIADGLDVPLSRVYGVVTFYNLFTLVPKGRHTISVCLGTSCYVRGGKRIMEHVKDLLQIKDGGTTEDMRFSLESIRCMGACALAPVVRLDKDLYSHVTVTKIPEILSRYV